MLSRFLGRKAIILGFSIFSMSLLRGDRREIGLYEEGSEGGLLGFRIGII